MDAKPDGGTRIKWYQATGAAVLVTIGLWAGGLLLSQWTSKSSPVDRSTLPIPTSPSPQASPIEPISSQPDPKAIANRQGTLRISNPTDYPIRVALLSKVPTSPKPNYDVPAHWDFAPQEGSSRGLVVSLPDRSVKLQKGDVLVAFAQDGSRRYWGPYVVDATEAPAWNSKAGEWQLTLQP